MTIPFHVMKEIISDLKALEASEEAKNFLLDPNSDEGKLYLAMHFAGGFNLSRSIYAFIQPPSGDKLSQQLTSTIASLTLNFSDCISFQNAPSPTGSYIFYDAMKERGYDCGNASSPDNMLIKLYWINTKHGLFLLPRHF